MGTNFSNWEVAKYKTQFNSNFAIELSQTCKAKALENVTKDKLSTKMDASNTRGISFDIFTEIGTNNLNYIYRVITVINF